MKKLIPFSGNLCSKEAKKMLSLKINDGCNMRCSFCVDRGGKKSDIVDIYKMASEAITLEEYQDVIITGGEPFLVFQDVVLLTSLLRKKKSRIVLNTNGTLLSETNVNLLNGKIDELQISIHNFNEDKHSKILGGKISFDKLRESLKWKEFSLSINSTFNNSYTEDEIPVAVDRMVELAKYLGADKLRLTELKKVSDKDFVEAGKFFDKDSPVLSYSSEELIQKGCTHYFNKSGVDVSVKRLCDYAKGEDAPAFSCCFINLEGQNKIEVDTKETFRVIYPDGKVTNDWIFNNLTK